jgi:hypothetical protein
MSTAKIGKKLNCRYLHIALFSISDNLFFQVWENNSSMKILMKLELICRSCAL